MKKLTLILSLLFLSGFIAAQKTVHVYNQTYVVKGDMVCESYIGDTEPKPLVTCYAYLNDHQLVYSRVFTVDKIVILLEVYEIDITLLDLKNAKIDLDVNYVSNPVINCIQIQTIESKSTISYTEYDGKCAAVNGNNTILNIDFNDEKKAKDYLKELKAAAKK